MRDLAGKLARVQWRMGQALLPEHLEAQEEAMMANVELRFGGFPAPLYGFSRIEWSQGLLQRGVLSLSRATLVMPSGVLVDIPGNTRSEPFGLDALGVSRATIFCHLLPGADQAPADQTGWQAETNAKVPRLTYELALSTEQSISGTLSALKLGSFEKRPDGQWMLCDDYVPPLSCIGTSAFLMPALAELGETLNAFVYRLLEETYSAPDGGGSFASKDTLFVVYRIQRMLGDLAGEIKFHPFEVYEGLRDLYVAICLYHHSVPERAKEHYKHEDIAGRFNEVLSALRDHLTTSSHDVPYVSFVQNDGVWQADLPREVHTARQVFLLVQKSSVTQTIELSDLKLASPNRLPTVHRMALDGIPLKAVARPAAAQSFGPEIEFLEINRGEEWQHALRQSQVVFYATQQGNASGHRFYLYWVAN